MNHAYTKKPVTIEAFQMTVKRRTDNSDWPVWLSHAWQKNRSEVGSAHPTVSGTSDGTVSINTLEGEMLVNFDDYIIKGIKGELYPCKPDIFEATYTIGAGVEALNKPKATARLDIGEAVEYLRLGHKVRRKGWNGAGMWIVFMDELKLPPFSDQTTHRKVNDRTAKHIGEDAEFHSLPYIAMWTAQGKWQPGWVCSQADLLANDWEAVL